MRKFEFSENALFFKLKDGRSISDDIIDHVFADALNVDKEDDLYDERRRKSFSKARNMKYSFLAFVRKLRPTCFKEGTKVEDKWWERRFAYLLIVEYKNYVSIVKSNIKSIRKIRSEVDPIDYNILCRIFTDNETKYKRFGINNLDISDYAMRSKVLEAENLKSVFSTIGANNYALGSYRLTNTVGSYSVGFSQSKINHLNDNAPFNDLLLWMKWVIDEIMANEGKEIDNYLSVFATPVNYIKEYDSGNLQAKYILVSLYRLYDEKWINRIKIKNPSPDGRSKEEKTTKDKICSLFEKAMKLKDDGDGNYSCSIADSEEIQIIVRGRGISFMCEWMKNVTLYGKVIQKSLYDYVMENGLYTILFKDPKLKYSNRKLFKDNRLTGNIDIFLDLLEEFSELDSTISEKGKLKDTNMMFPKRSLFRFVEDKFDKPETIMVCDDLGTEWADHIRIGRSSVALFAAKHKDLCFSATAFQEVVGQAQKNLGVFFPLETQWKSKKAKWGKTYNLNKIRTKIKRIRTKGKTSKEAVEFWQQAEMNGNYQKDLYLVIDFLSKKVLRENLTNLKNNIDFEEKKEAIPMLWLLSSLWSSCQELNIKLHITCRR